MTGLTVEKIAEIIFEHVYVSRETYEGVPVSTVHAGDAATAILALIEQDRAEEVARLREALTDAREMVETWGAYAPEYFQTKHDLAGDLACLDAALSGAAEKEGGA